MTISIPERRPEWLKVRAPRGENYQQLKQLMRSQALHTVCEEARCPNIGECWGHKTATFMILGRVCTRSCGFCAVETGRPLGLDWEESHFAAPALKKAWIFLFRWIGDPSQTIKILPLILRCSPFRKSITASAS